MPEIEAIKRAYANEKYPIEDEGIQKQFSADYLQNNQIKLSKVFWHKNQRFFVVEKEPTLEEKIQNKDEQSRSEPFLIAENTLDEKAKAYLLQFIP